MQKGKAKEEQTLNSGDGSRNELQVSINSSGKFESEAPVASDPPQLMKIQLQGHKGLFICENQTQDSLNCIMVDNIYQETNVINK
jgi:hypothetical protein